MIDVISLADYIVLKSLKDKEPVTNLQLQKILYFIQEWHIKSNKGKPLFMEDMEAWMFGPVQPDCYYRYSVYGSRPIKLLYGDTDQRYKELKNTLKTSLENSELIEEIDSIIEEKRRLRPWELVEQSHVEGGPWHRAYIPGFNNIIEKEDIYKYGR